ncbi:hypothetical protein PEDI_10490 [Persicobacter diffluens]|uniref:Uncharacterized protein n=1 Tax=Persicobacter diffluens TaxID=981 RepID=A0AAN4VX22_9BACT|nr:hypothetical protein PEDI_10490 [Persicobacter diffluens]
MYFLMRDWVLDENSLYLMVKKREKAFDVFF